MGGWWNIKSSLKKFRALAIHSVEIKSEKAFENLVISRGVVIIFFKKLLLR
jgi:hypothetical protein